MNNQCRCTKILIFKFIPALLLVVALHTFHLSFGQPVFSPEDLLGLETASVHDLSPDGRLLAFSTSEKNLIDQRYMFPKLKVKDLATGEVVMDVGNIGKLGNYPFKEEGTCLASASALNINDHAVLSGRNLEDIYPKFDS